jgi:hypothetical protein
LPSDTGHRRSFRPRGRGHTAIHIHLLPSIWFPDFHIRRRAVCRWQNIDLDIPFFHFFPISHSLAHSVLFSMDSDPVYINLNARLRPSQATVAPLSLFSSASQCVSRLADESSRPRTPFRSVLVSSLVLAFLFCAALRSPTADGSRDNNLRIPFPVQSSAHLRIFGSRLGLVLYLPFLNSRADSPPVFQHRWKYNLVRMLGAWRGTCVKAYFYFTLHLLIHVLR